jgi:hypothetical protein
MATRSGSKAAVSNRQQAKPRQASQLTLHSSFANLLRRKIDFRDDIEGGNVQRESYAHMFLAHCAASASARCVTRKPQSCGARTADQASVGADDDKAEVRFVPCQPEAGCAQVALVAAQVDLCAATLCHNSNEAMPQPLTAPA